MQLIGVGAPTAQHIPRGSKEDSSPAAQDATSAAVTAVADGPFASCQQHRNPAPQNHQQVPLFLVQVRVLKQSPDAVCAALAWYL